MLGPWRSSWRASDSRPRSSPRIVVCVYRLALARVEGVPLGSEQDQP